MRILLAALLTLAALVAAAPTGSAVAICSTQHDAQDLVIGDDPLARESCTTENIISHDCDLVVTVHQDGSVTRSLRCEPLIYCVTDPCPGPYAETSAALAAPSLPCQADANPTDDNGVSATCPTPVTTCSVHALWFGAWLQQPPVAYGCSKPGVWPPYDCVQDCDGPPTE